MEDRLTAEQRAAHMKKVRGTGNKSTELAVEKVLLDVNILGWKKHPKLGRSDPDFYFPDHKLAVYIDGCFWHACPVCNRNRPANRAEFWAKKIDDNRKRDNRLRRRLRLDGYHVMRVWEHELKEKKWVSRLKAMLTKTTPTKE